MKDEVKAIRLSFILHPSAFILPGVGMALAERAGRPCEETPSS
jgi:hypothetical protein